MSETGDDIDDLRRRLTESEARLAESEQQLCELRSELQHRVRNALAVIRSVIRRSAEHCETIEDYRNQLDGRIASLARVQAATIRDPTVGMDLALLLSDELGAVLPRWEDRISIRGPDCRLSARAASMLALAFHELATNALQYGALSALPGKVDIAWHLDSVKDGQLQMDWIETSIRLDPPIAERHGFGTEVLTQALPYELEGSAALNFQPGGLHCRILLPASCLMADATGTD